MTKDASYQYKHDVWNRLVEVKTREDGVVIATHTYDGTGRRIEKVVDHSGTRDTTEHDYYAGPRVAKIRRIRKIVA